MAFGQLHVGRDEIILDPDIPIIDSHHHLFDRPALRYMFEDYLADCRSGHRIVASVYSETQAFARTDGPEVMRPLGEIEFANGMAAVSASGVYGPIWICAGIVGHTDFRRGDAVAEFLDSAMQVAPDRFRGIRQTAIDHPSEAPYRFITHRPPRGIMQHPDFRKGYRHLGPRGLSYDAAVFDHQLPEVASLADAFPDTTIVLNHLGHMMGMDVDPSSHKEVFDRWHTWLRDLAQRPNVVCKIGGLGMPFWGFRLEERTDPIGYLELADLWRPFVETVIACFGPERCMMESNYPPDSRSAGFVPLWNALKHIVRHHSPEEKDSLFWRSAVNHYRLKLDPGLARELEKRPGADSASMAAGVRRHLDIMLGD